MNDLKDPVNDVDDTISDRKVGLLQRTVTVWPGASSHLDHRLGHVVLADDGDLVAGGLGEELGPADGSEAAVGEGGLEVGAGHLGAGVYRMQGVQKMQEVQLGKISLWRWLTKCL